MGLCNGVGNIGAGASANDLKLSYAREKAYGVIPQAPFNGMRVTSESLAITEDTTNDSEIRNDRQGGTPIRTALNVGGDVGYELSYRNFEDFFEGALFDCWQDILELSVLSATLPNTFTVASADTAFITVGDRIFFYGDEYANGQYTIKAIDALSGEIEVEETIAKITIDANSKIGVIKAKLAVGGYEFSAVDNSLSCDVGDNAFEKLDLVEGQYVKVSGTVSNNGDFRVVSKANDKIIFESGIKNETLASKSISLSASRLRNGIVNHSYTFEKSQVNGEFYQYTGMMISSLALSIATGSVLSGTMTLVGKGEENTTTSVAYNQVTRKAYDDKNFNSVSDVGKVTFEGAESSAAVQSLSFTIANNIEQQKQIGSIENAGVFAGNCDVTGDISLYYKDKTIYDSFLREDMKIISFPISYLNRGYRFTLNAKLTNPQKNTEGVNQSIIQSYNLVGVPHKGFKIQIDRF